MEKALKSFCFNSSESGLFLLDMPTGTGKTYKVRNFIKKNLNTKLANKRIIYITGLKKNLDEKYFFEEFGDKVLFLDSNVDTLVKNFENIYDLIPEHIKKADVTKRIKICINLINSSDSKVKDYKKEAERSLREQLEFEFRSLIEEYLEKDENGKQRSISQKKELISKDENYIWIARLYPAVFTDEARILLLSMDKFLLKNSTIIEPSYDFASSKLIEDSIIFIDEFDSTKDIILKHIINSACDNKLNIIDLFRQIYAGLSNTEFTKKLTQSSLLLDKKIETNKNYQTPDQIIEALRNKAKKINSDYRLIYYHKMEDSLRTNKAFLFQDYNFKTIINNDRKTLVLDIDEKQNTTWIKNKEKDLEDNNTINIAKMLTEIKAFITYFRNAIGILATNYNNLQNQVKKDTRRFNHYGFEASIKTVLSEFGIDGKHANYISGLVLENKSKKRYSFENFEEKIDFSIYQKGFRYYMFSDNEFYDTQTKVQFYSYDMTPEKLMLNICKKTKIVGISATSKLPNVTGNFDISYLKKHLKNNFYEYNEEDLQEIREQFESYNKNYNKVKIIPKSVNITKENFEKYVLEFSENVRNAIKIIFQDLEKVDEEKDQAFSKARYVKLFYTYKFFLENEQIGSFMFLSSKALKNFDKSFDFKKAKTVFNLMKQETNTCNIFEKPLYGEAEFYEKEKAEVIKRLGSGERGFIVSTYQTLGAGQNLQYEIPCRIKDEIIAVNDLPYGDNQKDFDAIYLDEPTYILPQVNNAKEEDLAKYIFQIKFLESVGDINPNLSEDYIVNAFKLSNGGFGYTKPHPQTKHISATTAKIIQQAVGRICRTKNKSSEIYILYDISLKNKLKGTQDLFFEHKLLNKEFRYLLNNIYDGESFIDNKLEILINKAIKNNDSSKSHVDMLMSNWSDEHRSEWITIREHVLKHPTISHPQEYEFFYLELPDNRNEYYALNKQTSNDQVKLCELSLDFISGEHNKYDEKRANLDKLLKINGVKQLFEHNGYATSIKKDKYILTPVAFDGLYKGALGEVVGKYLLERELNIKLNTIDTKEQFEKFDFVYNDIYIDFKNRSADDPKPERTFVNIEEKLKKCQGKLAMIINIMQPNENNHFEPYQTGNVLIIPYLYDHSGNKCLDAFYTIMQIIEEYKSK